MNKIISIICLAALVSTQCVSVKAADRSHISIIDASTLMIQGFDMTPHDVNLTIIALKKKPDSLKDHILLAAYYGYKQSPDADKYALWLIAHYPAAPIFGGPPFIPPSDAQAVLWRKQLVKYPLNTLVLANAASSLKLNDASQSIAIYKKLMKLQPSNHKWPLHIARIIQFQINPNYGSPEDNESAAKHAMKYAQMSFNLAKSNRTKLNAIEELMMDAYYAQNYTQANDYALMEHKYLPSSDPTLDPDVIYHSYMMQGLVALHNKDIPAADNFLLKSGQSSGSAPLDSFGPNMMLADQLLQNGQKAVVLQFLQECATFWNEGTNTLKQWMAEIKQGQHPDFSMQENY